MRVKRSRSSGSSLSIFPSMVLPLLAILTAFFTYALARLSLASDGVLLSLYFISLVCIAAFSIYIILYFNISLLTGLFLFATIGTIVVIKVRFEVLYFWLHEKEFQQAIDTPIKRQNFQIFKYKEGFGFPSGASWEYIVYDPSDQITVAPERRNAAWQQLHGNQVAPPISQCSVKIQHIKGHFFYLAQTC